MSQPDLNSFSRSIKILVSNLEKTKERIQARFLEVDERLDQLEQNIITVNNKIKSTTSNYDDSHINDLENQISSLSMKIEELEGNLVKIQKEMEGSKIKQPLPTPQITKIEAPITLNPMIKEIPTTKAKMEEGKSNVPPSPNSEIPKPATPPSNKTTERPKAVSIPPPPGSTKLSSSLSEDEELLTSSAKKSSIDIPPPPSAPSSSKSSDLPSTQNSQRTKINIKDDDTERDRLLEALKQLDAITE